MTEKMRASLPPFSSTHRAFGLLLHVTSLPISQMPYFLVAALVFRPGGTGRISDAFGLGT
jgi:hypothetical protein